jgi:glycosyltransferase involved in cell wall biosynthesis
MSDAAHIAVCVSTFHRADGLARVLRSLDALEFPGGAPRIRILVVNNDPGDPRPGQICRDVAGSMRWPIECIAEAERGLAAPRNRAIDHVIADHEFIAFIDDDSRADTGWLAALLAVQQRTDADVVTGPVEPRYARTPEPWIEQGRFFARRHRPTGARVRTAFTNNVLIRAAFLRATGLRVDLRFGLIGGEDVHFFRRVHAAGGRMVWANEAIVEDDVPEERMSADWLIRRHRRTGMTTALIERDLRAAAIAIPLVAGRALAWVVLGAARLAAGLIAGRACRVRGRCWLAWGTGLAKGLVGRTYAEYLEER